ncbi:MAG: multifunctional CCA addition/repair protein [Thiothrix sp.]|nr:multifunctional CCA addition/repair protein [Thiothrix sp.]
MRYFLVGGAVRDRLLGLPVKDRDWVVTGATPENMLAMGFMPVGKDFPVFLHPETREEYALARTERKTAPGYHGFRFHAAPDVTLEQDLLRRDLTINALAEDENGQVLDVSGGLLDLERRLLRHASPAFVEDPVRILRLARFAARLAPLGFQVAPETLVLMQAMVDAGEVDALVPERVWQELVRALSEPVPRRFIEVLRACGALKVLFPELDALFGVPQVARHHPEIDTGLHTLMVLEQAAALSNDPRIRFAALTHDLGKGTTPVAEWPRHHGHETRSAGLVEQLCQRYRVPGDFRELAVLVARHHLHIHRAGELTPRTLLKVMEQCDAFRRPERFHDLLLACQADARGRAGREQSPYPQRDWFVSLQQACLAVDVRPIVAAGFRGEQIRRQLHEQRIHAIRHLRREWLPPQVDSSPP